jgi:uroporphyrinogen-III synthase
MPLTLVLTQPAARATVLADALRGEGIEVACWPLTSIEEAPGLDWAAVATLLARCRWVLLPSPGSIDTTLGAFARCGLGWPAATGIGLIGPGSREALAGWGDRVAGLAEAEVVEPLEAPHDARALLARPEFRGLDGVEIAVLRRADGQQAWLDTLRARGAVLHPLTVYVARDLAPPAAAADWLDRRLRQGGALAVSIASRDAGARLAAWAAASAGASRLLEAVALTQHPRIAEALARQGWRRVRCHAPGVKGLKAAIESVNSAPR